MDNQYKQISGRASVDNSTKSAVLLTSASGCIVRLISVHIFITTVSSGGTGIVTLRDGAGGTILVQLDATATKNTLTHDMDFHDGLGYPMTVNTNLYLEVSGATTDASVIAVATGFLTGF